MSGAIHLGVINGSIRGLVQARVFDGDAGSRKIGGSRNQSGMSFPAGEVR
jgi:hypothetical protein